MSGCDLDQCQKCQSTYEHLKNIYIYDWQIIGEWTLACHYCEGYDDMWWYTLLACERLAEEKGIEDILKLRIGCD